MKVTLYHMGIHDLSKLIQRYAPASITLHPVHHYQNKHVAIDSTLYLHRSLYQLNVHPHPFPHLLHFFNFSKTLQRHKITPIWIFDGSERLDGPEKRKEWERRKKIAEWTKLELIHEQKRLERLQNFKQLYSQARNYAEGLHAFEPSVELQSIAEQNLYNFQPFQPSNNQIDISADLLAIKQRFNDIVQDFVASTASKRSRPDSTHFGLELALYWSLHRATLQLDRFESLLHSVHNRYTSLLQRQNKVSSDHLALTKQLLHVLGEKVLNSRDQEGESVCAALNLLDRVHGVVSEDLDVLAHGDTVLLRGFFPGENGRRITVQQYDHVRERLEMTREQFVDMCILCGSDYGGKVAGIGMVNAVKGIRSFGSIEKLVATKNITISDQMQSDWDTARRVFLKEPQEILKSTVMEDGPQVSDEERKRFLEEWSLLDSSDGADVYYERVAKDDGGGLGPNPF